MTPKLFGHNRIYQQESLLNKHLLQFYRLFNETCGFVLMQAGMQANQFASVIDCGGNIKNFTEKCGGKILFLKTRKRLDLKFLFLS